jgi:hypothetical protein
MMNNIMKIRAFKETLIIKFVIVVVEQVRDFKENVCGVINKFV